MHDWISQFAQNTEGYASKKKKKCSYINPCKIFNTTLEEVKINGPFKTALL